MDFCQLQVTRSDFRPCSPTQRPGWHEHRHCLGPARTTFRHTIRARPARRSDGLAFAFPFHCLRLPYASASRTALFISRGKLHETAIQPSEILPSRPIVCVELRSSTSLHLPRPSSPTHTHTAMEASPLPPWGSAVAGATGAVLANAMVYPLDM